VNGDGFADVIIGGPGASPNGGASGAVFVLYGKASGFQSEQFWNIAGNDGVRIDGEAAGDNAGVWVSSADINGDGIADILIGADRAHPNGANSGANYVVFGKSSGFGGDLPLSSLDGTNGFQINGETAGDFSGYSISSAGDVNGDGFGDIIIGSPPIWNYRVSMEPTDSRSTACPRATTAGFPSPRRATSTATAMPI
jgi:hypothetical protein